MPTIIAELHADVVRATVDLVEQAAESDLTRPTPCAGWDLADLLGHMIAQHHGFAAAARGQGGDLAVWRPVRPGAEFRKSYAEAAADVLDAFAAPGVLDEPVLLPELSPDRPFPGHRALAFHLVDYVVHGWDVSKALGLPFAPSPEVLAVTLPIARAVPDGAARLAPGAAFAPAIPLPPGADALTEILLLLGRRP